MTQFLAKGAFGSIFKTDDEVTKINIHDRDFLGIRCLPEYDIASRLIHPNLIHAKRISPEGHLIFPYYPYTIWSKEFFALPSQRKEILVEQLLSAVFAIHKAGYLHLDIKGNNIFINDDMTNLVLADFGSAIWIGSSESKTLTRECVSPFYRSPEHIRARIAGQKELTYSREDDYWALGLSVLECLSEKEDPYYDIAFDHNETFYYDQKNRLINYKFIKELCPNLSQRWYDTLVGLLSWDPTDRQLPLVGTYQSAKLVTPHYGKYRKDYLNDEIKDFLKQNMSSYIGEPVESIFLAIDLYIRTRHLHYTREKILLTCVWISLKMITSCTIDPRDICEDEDLWIIEQEIIKEVKGVIYPPNPYNSSLDSDDLYLAWQKIGQPVTDPIYIFNLNQITIRQFRYIRDF